MRLIPFLNYGGNCREAFAFYAKVLRGKIVSELTYGDSPMCDQMPKDSAGWIAHTQLESGGAVLMGADGPPPHGGTDTIVNIDVDSVEEAERIFGELSEGADVKMPMAETFWAQRWGMLVDRYGKPWMVNCMKQP